jgi:hypothetical protein
LTTLAAMIAAMVDPGDRGSSRSRIAATAIVATADRSDSDHRDRARSGR